MAWREQLSSGRYRGGYRDRQGRLQYTPETYTQPAEAEREAWKLEDKARKRPKYRRDAGKLTYREWVEQWWPDRAVEANTAGQDLIKMNKHILPQWGDQSLEGVEQDRDAVQAWVNELAATDLSASTVAKVFYLFSASLKAAVLAERISTTPCVAIKLPPIPPSDERYLERQEYAAIREQLPEKRDKLLADLLVYTGARWGEAVAVHRRRISRTRKLLSIHDAYEAASDSIKAYPKGKAKRGVPLTDDLLSALLGWMDDHPAQCAMTHKKGSKCEGDLLFSDNGRVLDYSHWEKYVWRPAVKAADVGHTRIHDLRHSFASWLIQAGRPLEEIGDLLGHASWQTTQRYADLAKAHWEKVRTALTSGHLPPPDKGADEALLQASIERLAAQDPQRWGPVAAALAGGSGTAEQASSGVPAPDLLHDDHPQDGAKIIQMGRRRRSMG